MPNVGEKAPDFNALDTKRERFILSKAVAKGKTLLVFYPGDDTPVCSTQLSDYAQHYEDFKKLGVQIYGITITTYNSQKEFAEKLKAPFPLLNDYDFRITQKYKVMSMMGVPKRALFLIDEKQTILYKQVEILPIFYRNSEEVLEEIQKAFPATIAPEETEVVSSNVNV